MSNSTSKTTDPRITLVQGDIVEQQVDAIVNAANEQLLPGGGVCGAIHAAAGPELASACAAIGSCPTGEARITPSFRLEQSQGIRWVIHAVGPIWHGGTGNEAELLAAAYRSALAIAADAQHAIRTLALPTLSTGIYGYPPDAAALIQLRTINDFLHDNTTLAVVRIVAFDAQSLAYLQTARETLTRAE